MVAEDEPVELQHNDIPHRPGLLRIAPELRNQIYDILLEDHRKSRGGADEGYTLSTFFGAHRRSPTPEATVNIRSSLPSITKVCKQTRDETRQMYFASADFFAHVEKSNPLYRGKIPEPSYDLLLEILHNLGPEVAKSIKSLAIVCQDPHTNESGRREPSGLNLGLVRVWNRFIPQLLASGIQPHQLRWPFPIIERPATDASSTSVPVRARRLVRLAVLYEGVIVPALEKYDCIDPDHPLPDIMKSVAALPGRVGGGFPARSVAGSLKTFAAARKLENERVEQD